MLEGYRDIVEIHLAQKDVESVDVGGPIIFILSLNSHYFIVIVISQFHQLSF